MADVVLRKVVTKSDTVTRLDISTRSLVYLPNFFHGSNQVKFEAVDITDSTSWRFTCRQRSGKYLKPVVSGDWLALVRAKGIRIGDRVTVMRKSWDAEVGFDQYEFVVERKIVIFGVAVWVPI